MFRQMLRALIPARKSAVNAALKAAVRAPRPPRFAPTLQSLEQREVPAVLSSFSNGVLIVLGDDADNNFSVNFDSTGTAIVNGGTVPIVGGAPTTATLTRIVMFGQGGNDTLAVGEQFGAVPETFLFGGDGDDLLIGGSANDLLFGEGGNDRLAGNGGTDFLFGGNGNDVLVGGTGGDGAFGEGGDDQMIWLPGHGSDLNEGGAGTDSVLVLGGGGDETFTANADGGRVRFDRTSTGAFFLDIGGSENLILNMAGGNDTFTGGALAGLVALTVQGGDGNDTILGGNGADTLLGDAGDDFVDGNQGADTVHLGDGNDTFQWDPGDGSDVVEGDAGTDTMVFNGSGGAEIFAASANGGRMTFTRNLGNIVMDTNGLEELTVNANGGADAVTINDLTGTGVTAVNIDLGVSDAAADIVTVNGTAGADVIQTTTFNGGVQVLGSSAAVNITNSEVADDRLVLAGLGGSDVLSGGALAALVQLTLDGGDGDDTLNGGNGADTLIGGGGNDTIDGNQGADTALMGDGDDTFVWDPGDGSDVIEGQAGTDTLLFNGSAGAESFLATATLGRLRFTRNIGNIVMDTDDVEVLTLNALGGEDLVTIDNLSATDVRTVNIDLGVGGAGDAEDDGVLVFGTAGSDLFVVSGGGGAVTVQNPFLTISVTNAEPANDQLVVGTFGGADVVNAAGLADDSVRLLLNGGDGDDVLIGSAGNDTINGDAGDDILLGGSGDDTLNGGADIDFIDGGAGTDTAVNGETVINVP